MAIRVNHCIVFKFESIIDICSALININNVVCCSLDIGGCIAAETLCSLLTYSLYFIYFGQIIVLQMLQLYVK